MEQPKSERTTASSVFLAALLIPSGLALAWLVRDGLRISSNAAALAGGVWLTYLYFQIAAGSSGGADESGDSAD